MRNKHILIVLSVLAALAAVAMVVSAGDPDNPSGPPETTSSYTLEHIYDRLSTGASGVQITFTEPISGPTVGTGYTLDEIMGIAPSVDDTSGASLTQVLSGTTYWGLRNGAWGLQTGTMPNNGTVTITPTTTQQTITAGYHDGSGYVEGDTDLVAGNIKGGVSVFGVDGKLYAPVSKTGQTTGYATGDDGNWEMGIVWPNPRFTDNGDGTVTDNLTELIWLKNANCWHSQTWANALTNANGLANGSCGLTDDSSAGDWRLPNVRELQSLIDYGERSPALPDGHSFTSVQLGYHWSSTTWAGVADYAWAMTLNNGNTMPVGKAIMYYVWPVRGGE